ncbi:MAG: TetR/AcrR family transcriptional regulator [Coriobacteriia bacterium]|nr:TetR/AcrR family transcriptional regulator [Coriobacteriia bacterium]
MAPSPDVRRREQLLDELEALILREGFAHLKVGALAEELRCSRSTLYKLAPDKRSLIVLVLDRWVDHSIAYASSEASRVEGAAERVLRFCAVIDRARAGVSPQAWHDAMTQPLGQEVFGRGYKKGTEALKLLLDEGVASGDFHKANTPFIAHSLWMAGRGMQDPETLERLGVSRAEAADELTRFVVEGMRCGR